MTMPRRMREYAFREDQWQRRYEPHVEAINRYIDQQLGDTVPYVPPLHGGCKARLLNVLSDPGPMAQHSRFVCIENDDPTAETLWHLFHNARIPAHDAILWNAYPWYINKNPTAAQLSIGIVPLKRIIDLLPQLKVVMLHGGTAHRAWKKFVKANPTLVKERGLCVIKTYHPSRQAFIHKDPKVREMRRQHIVDAFTQCRQELGPTQTNRA
ncbi:uracil-DNA glycosylase [Chlorobium phaeovibrioides]|uniref:Uracil-DNA glycosylase n=1 Tax=Chlorobium phaeovibrioides TaxID=1094 RepID=A0A432ASI7_CHLPH|nr:uracil-DNA glycosylase [Chlorobium phaeovibrioides]RTY35931.1 uracil-DNA glycosylase [Chlorobium phaeovibrioides]